MSAAARESLRIDQFGQRSQRHRPASAGRAVVVVPMGVVFEAPARGPQALGGTGAAAAQGVPQAGADGPVWQPRAHASLQALRRHGYALLLSDLPAAESSPGAHAAAAAVAAVAAAEGCNGIALGKRQDGAGHDPGSVDGVPFADVLPLVEPQTLPPVLLQMARRHRLDLHSSWFLGWDDALGAASRRVGCRTLRLLEPGRPALRRWPLLRGHVPMTLSDAVLYILRGDGHLRGPDPGRPAAWPDAAGGPGRAGRAVGA